jgi:hypothetical protein
MMRTNPYDQFIVTAVNKEGVVLVSSFVYSDAPTDEPTLKTGKSPSLFNRDQMTRTVHDIIHTNTYGTINTLIVQKV